MALIYTFDQALSDSEIWSSVDRRRKPLETWFGGCERSPLRKRSTSRVGGSSPRSSRRAKGWVRKPRPSVHRECSAYHDRVVVRECVSILCPGQSRSLCPKWLSWSRGKALLPSGVGVGPPPRGAGEIPWRSAASVRGSPPGLGRVGVRAPMCAASERGPEMPSNGEVRCPLRETLPG